MLSWPGCNPLLDQSVQIALDYLERSGEVDDASETCLFLTKKVEAMIARGQHSKLVLANRAIADFQRYRKARTIELTATC